jgi:hypothetical protein
MTITKAVLKAAALACALAIAGVALYSHDAIAQAARSAISKTPGTVTEMVGLAATITSTLHYQAQLDLTCGGTGGAQRCAGDFPKPGTNRQLNITRIACFFEASGGSEFRFGAIDLINSTGTAVLGETVPVDVSAPNFGGVLFTLNRAVDMQIAAAQHMRPHLDVTGGTVIDASCTVTGTLSTLG